MKLNITAAAAILLFGTSAMTYADDNVQVVQALPTTTSTGLYTANRDPLAPSPLAKLPIGAIKPKGWLLHQLQLEADGMTGHLEELSPWCKFEGSAWSDPKGKGTNGWEEMPYWLKGYGDLGYVLHDKRIIDDARRWIEAALASQEADGWFGPQANKHSGGEAGGHADFWPNMLMLNVMQSYYEYSHDPRVLTFLTKYFRFQLDYNDAHFLPGSWAKVRAGDNLESVYWLYNRTGEPWLLELAEKDPSPHRPLEHRSHRLARREHLPGLPRAGRLLRAGQRAKFLDAAERNYQRFMGEYGQFPGGGFAADEVCRAGYGDPRQGCETCSWVELMHSFEMLAKIGGNPLWADRCEEVAFNSLPAAMLADEKGLHYLTGANLAVCDTKNKAPGIGNGGNMLAYSPWDFRCCQHNVSHGWPYFAEELWHATADRGLCATMYAACDVTAKVGPGEGTTVQIAATTDYPFSDTVALKLTTPSGGPLPPLLPRAAVVRKAGRLDQRQCGGRGRQAALVHPHRARLAERRHGRGEAAHGRQRADLGEEQEFRVSRLRAADLLAEDRRAVVQVPRALAEVAGVRVLPTTPWNYGLVLDADDSGRFVRAGPRRGPAARPAVHARDRTTGDQGEGPADPRLDAG